MRCCGATRSKLVRAPHEPFTPHAGAHDWWATFAHCFALNVGSMRGPPGAILATMTRAAEWGLPPAPLCLWALLWWLAPDHAAHANIGAGCTIVTFPLIMGVTAGSQALK